VNGDGIKLLLADSGDFPAAMPQAKAPPPPTGSVMRIFPSIRHESARRRSVQAGLLLISLAVVVLFGASLGPRSYAGALSSLLLALVLIALCVAIVLHVRFLILSRHEHCETASVLDATEREFQSIFDSTLDSILILDDSGICLEANPAALALLGTQRNEIVGHSIKKFHSPVPDFEAAWKHFLDRKDEHGEAQLIRQEGEEVFIEYTAKANYLPGRHVAVLRDISLRKQAEAALRTSDERFQQMADNIQEVYWLLDARTKHIVYVNPAYETITGRSLASLRDNPTSYQEAFHPEDRVRVLTRLDEATRTGHLDEEVRIIRPDHVVRWVSVRGFPVRDSAGIIRRLVGVSQDISARKSAEEQMAKNLALAESAWAEADAFRKTTLALTQNLKMDCVLDTLLESLLKLIPCESARVLLVETDTHLFLQREIQKPEANRRSPKCPETIEARDSHFLMRVLATKNSVLISDTSEEPEWYGFKGHAHMRSWLCVPLVASQQVLGLLSLGDTRAHFFTHEHLCLAKSLAIPAAVAIQNARLYERAEIYGTELEQRISDLEQTERALQRAEESRTLSEEKFAKVFWSSPIAFSITTVAEGRFIDVNKAFERRYGHSGKELLGRTVFDIGVWDNPDERSQMLDQVREQGQVRNRITRFRTRSGELLDTIYSADIIELDGRQCLLAVSEDPPGRANLQMSLGHKASISA
jgi:PAS domain S-box-containing protein